MPSNHADIFLSTLTHKKARRNILSSSYCLRVAYDSNILSAHKYYSYPYDSSLGSGVSGMILPLYIDDFNGSYVINPIN